jgi:hypothetical protein
MARSFWESPKGGISSLVRGVDIEGNAVGKTWSPWLSMGDFTTRQSNKAAEERRTNACCFRYRVCNGRRCSIFRAVAGECVVEEEHASEERLPR